MEPGKENTRTENKNRFCSSLNIFSLRVFLLFIEHFQTRMFQHIVEISNKQIVSSISLYVFINFSMTNTSVMSHTSFLHDYTLLKLYYIWNNVSNNVIRWTSVVSINTKWSKNIWNIIVFSCQLTQFPLDVIMFLLRR